jgi:hypothetical protein
MKKRKGLKRVLIVLLLVFIVMQFVTIDKGHPKIVESNDFISITQPPKEIENLLRNACYDCHSYETDYPWYSSVAPVSWWLEHHVEEGREHLNFSEWAKYSDKAKKHKLHECEEEVEEGEMPLDSYTWTHGDASLTSAQKEKLAHWFKDQISESAP